MHGYKENWCQTITETGDENTQDQRDDDGAVKSLRGFLFVFGSFSGGHDHVSPNRDSDESINNQGDERTIIAHGGHRESATAKVINHQ